MGDRESRFQVNPLSAHWFAALPVLIWVYFLIARGGFWRIAAATEPPPGNTGPKRVVVVIPARDEAASIGTVVTSLAQQAFSGSIKVIVIDDESTDGTAEVAVAAARASGFAAHLTVIKGTALPSGWTGKLWALSQGVEASAGLEPDYLLFTDADICHSRDSIASLVANAEAHGRDLVSHMVRLSVATPAERLLIPAFVFFFFMLYPPAWVLSARFRTAAAAGGCILIRPQMLARIGGLESIRARIIDDCALAHAVKCAGGQIWLGLARETHSLRRYQSLSEIGAMISRTAFSQLRHSYALLVLTLLGLCVTYLLPAALLFARDPIAARLGLLGLLLMSLCYLPMVRFYRLAFAWCLCLPGIAVFYLGCVIHSAAQYARGRGGKWKGRLQDTQISDAVEAVPADVKSGQI